MEGDSKEDTGSTVDSEPTDDKTVDEPDETDSDSEGDTKIELPGAETAQKVVDNADAHEGKRAVDSQDDIESDQISDPPVDTETDTEPQTVAPTPEEIVRAFVDRLSEGDKTGVHELYHSNAAIDRFSRKDLLRLKQRDISIVSEFTRVREDPSRVVIEFIQAMNETEQTVSYELRVDRDADTDDCWQVFNIERTSDKRTLVN